MKMFVFIQIPLKFIPKSPTEKIDSDNGLAPNRQQAIIWTHNDLVYWHNVTYMHHSASVS